MTTHKNHPFHLVDKTPWPLTGAIVALIMMTGSIKGFHLYNRELMFLAMTIVSFTMIQRWRHVVRQGTYRRLHTKFFTTGVRWAMILFIISQLFSFLSFFSVFFHSSLFPTINIESLWPPAEILPFNPLQIPLLQMQLFFYLQSYCYLYTSRHLLQNNYHRALQGMFLTVTLRLCFTALRPFSVLSGSIYNCSFSLWLDLLYSYSLPRTPCNYCNYFFTNMLTSTPLSSLFGFEAAPSYWHFVDAVWLFLYVPIYWWRR